MITAAPDKRIAEQQKLNNDILFVFHCKAC